MSRASAAAAALLGAVVILAAGCSKSGPESAPSACLAGPAAYEAALRAAPGEVRLQGETPISDCLTQGQGGGELAQVGSVMVAVATRLNQEALRSPTGPATLRLGYLVGAARKGAERTGGIHTDLLRRLDSAAHFDPSGTPDPGFDRTFARGLAAGQESG